MTEERRLEPTCGHIPKFDQWNPLRRRPADRRVCEKARALTPPAWAAIEASVLPLAESRSVVEPSWPALATSVPSGDHATALIGAAPRRVRDRFLLGCENSPRQSREVWAGNRRRPPGSGGLTGTPLPAITDAGQLGVVRSQLHQLQPLLGLPEFVEGLLTDGRVAGGLGGISLLLRAATGRPTFPAAPAADGLPAGRVRGRASIFPALPRGT